MSHGTWRIGMANVVIALTSGTLVTIICSAHAVAQTAKPALVRDIDNGSFQPFHIQLFWAGSPGGPNGTTQFSVPANKRLVIEYVAANCESDPSHPTMAVSNYNLSGVGLTTTVNGTPVTYTMGWRSPFTGTVQSDFCGSQNLVRIYADPSTTVSSRPINYQGGMVISISGHYVDVP